MKRYFMLVLTFACLLSVEATAQTAAPASGTPTKRTDLYHVHFTKAVLGKAAQLGEGLKAQGPTGAMQGHFIILRHQEGDDWDYCVIEHLGPTTTVTAAGTPPTPTRDLSAWHGDTFASGPAWPDFAKAMGIGDPKVASPIYVVAVWRTAPGRRDDLDAMLGTPATGAKVPIGTVVLQHVEGAPWTFMAVSRYNSWQDFATDQAATTPAAGTGTPADGWSKIRELSTFHHDTIADRITK